MNKLAGAKPSGVAEVDQEAKPLGSVRLPAKGLASTYRCSINHRNIALSTDSA